jgi:hypothetical protein
MGKSVKSSCGRGHCQKRVKERRRKEGDGRRKERGGRRGKGEGESRIERKRLPCEGACALPS